MTMFFAVNLIDTVHALQNAMKKLAKGAGKVKKEKKTWAQPAAASDKPKKPKKAEVMATFWWCVCALVSAYNRARRACVCVLLDERNRTALGKICFMANSIILRNRFQGGKKEKGRDKIWE